MSKQKGYVTRAERRATAREVAKLLIHQPQGKTQFKVEYTLAFVVAAMGIIAGVVLSPPQTKPAAILWLCVLFLLGIYPALHFSAWAVHSRKAWIGRTCAIALLGLISIGVGLKIWPPFHRHILTQDERDSFEKPLKEQTSPRELVQLACAQADEHTCVYAAQFIALFRESGWRIQENRVARITLARPDAGVTLFKKGTGHLDPDNWRSGLWTTVSPSFVNVSQAFENIGIEPEAGANPELAEDAITVYFGLEKANEGEGTRLTELMKKYRAGLFPMQQ